MDRAKVEYYLTSTGENPVKTFIESLEKPQKAKIFRIFMYIQSYGLSAVLPHIRKLTGTLLWEIRILGHDNIRVLYVVSKKDTVLLLHGFIKKSQKTPTKELETALARYKAWTIIQKRTLDK